MRSGLGSERAKASVTTYVPFVPVPSIRGLELGNDLSPSPVMGIDFLLLGGMKVGQRALPASADSLVILVLNNQCATVGCPGTLPWVPTPRLSSVRHVHDR